MVSSFLQLYLNDAKVGNKIQKDVNRATIPLKPNRTYKINIQSLSSRSKYADSILSNSLTVTTSVAISGGEFANTNGIEMLTANDTVIHNACSMNDPQVTALRKFYEKENETDFEGQITIPIRVNKLTDEYIDIDWSGYNHCKHEYVDEYRIQWHCLNNNEHSEHKCPGNVTSYRIKKLRAGYTYAIKMSSLKSNNVVINRSKNYLLQLSAPPDCPILKLRACNFKYITMEWNRPRAYGENQVIAYKLYVDNKVEAVLSAEQTAFTLSKGEPCREYSFQVQAITADESNSSPMSPALSVIWPGIMAPNVRQLENENGIVRVIWDEPLITGNAKISYFRVVAENESTAGKTPPIVVGPLEGHIRECELHGLSNGRNKIYLEIVAFGMSEPFKSKPIYVEYGLTPEAPHLVVKIPGLEQRNKLDKIASNLVNKRDRLLKIVTNSAQSKHAKEVSSTVMAKAMATLRQLDEVLNDCLKLIASYTGFFVANLSWTCHQPSPLVKVIGFKVFVNGKQYGSDLHESIRSVRVRLSLERAIHNVYVAAYTDRNRMECQTSNCIGE